MTSVRAIEFRGDHLLLLDQRVLPRENRFVRCDGADDAAAAITDMVVRGAPAIGIVAAYGLALEALRGGDLDRAWKVLSDSRPTAVNLRWALERMSTVKPVDMVDEAVAIHREDIAVNRTLGDHGASLFRKDELTFYTHCNAGALATGGWGTSLGVVRSLHAAGRKVHVYAGETRPYLQGARLTAWECQQEGIDCTLVCDSVAATVIPRCDAVLVGVDRVASNGDSANKIGTLGLAVIAKHYGVPFYVCMPTSTLDRRCPNGAGIPIEQRDASEVRGHAGVAWAADVPVFNPAFDVTPADLITGWVTERGVWTVPFPVL